MLFTRVAFLLIVLLMGSDVEATCARCRLAAGWGLAIQPKSPVDTKVLRTYSGKVVSVQDVAKDLEVEPGIYVLLEAENKQYPVRLGSTEFLKKQNLSLSPQDEIECVGFEVDLKERTGIVATEVTSAGKNVRLRTDKGQEMW